MKKICSKCGDPKDRDDFPKNSKGRDGLYSKCKTCHNSGTKSSRLKHKTRNQEEFYDPKRPPKTCRICRATKSADQFQRNCWSPDGLNEDCAECHADLQSLRLYGLPLGGYALLLQRQGGMCGICKSTDPRSRGRFHVDHEHVDGFATLPRPHRRCYIRGLLCGPCNHELGVLEKYFGGKALRGLRAIASLLPVLSYLEFFDESFRRHAV